MAVDIGHLVERSKKGDRKSFAALYDHFMPKIFRFIYYRTFKHALSEDITSETFLKALEKLGQYDAARGSFSAWIYQIARNCLMDFYRSKPGLTVDIEYVAETASPDDPAEDAIRRQEYEKLLPYLAELTPDQKDVVLMRLWDDLSYREIAEILEKSPDACKVHFSRAIAVLKSKMPFMLFVLFVLFRQILNQGA